MKDFHLSPDWYTHKNLLPHCRTMSSWSRWAGLGKSIQESIFQHSFHILPMYSPITSWAQEIKNKGQKNVITKGRQELCRKTNIGMVPSNMEMDCMWKSNYTVFYKLKFGRSQRSGQYPFTVKMLTQNALLYWAISSNRTSGLANHLSLEVLFLVKIPIILSKF